MHLAHYLTLLHRSQLALADALRQVGEAHADEADVAILCRQQAEVCDGIAERVQPFPARYAPEAPGEPDRLHTELFDSPRGGSLGLLRDLHDLYLMACEADVVWTLVGQAASAVRDHDLLGVVQESEPRTALQLRWLRTRLRQAAPQALVVSD